MNKKFLWFWVPFTIVWSSLALYRYLENQNLVILFSCMGFFGLIMVFEIIRKHKDFQLEKTELTIKQIFHTTKKLNINSIQNWREEHFYYNGQAKKSLILKTQSGKKVTITDKDDVKEYNKLFQYLRINLSDKIKPAANINYR